MIWTWLSPRDAQGISNGTADSCAQNTSAVAKVLLLMKEIQSLLQIIYSKTRIFHVIPNLLNVHPVCWPSQKIIYWWQANCNLESRSSDQNILKSFSKIRISYINIILTNRALTNKWWTNFELKFGFSGKINIGVPWPVNPNTTFFCGVVL